MTMREIIKTILYSFTLRKINAVVSILLGIERSRFGTYEAFFYGDRKRQNSVFSAVLTNVECFRDVLLCCKVARG